MAANWSELQRNLLELILEKLDLVDHGRFASVCSSWRSAAVENPPINKPLYCAFSHRPKRLVRRFITSFIPSWKVATFIGAALDGWLVILVDGRDLFLLNKALNSMILLPPPPSTDIIFWETLNFWKAVLSSPPSSSSSSDECTVVIKHIDTGVFYCRLGSDKSFTMIFKDIILDIQFNKGQLYVLCFPNKIKIFDHLFNNKVTQNLDHWDHLGGLNLGFSHLLTSGNKLLIAEMIDEGSPPTLIFKFKRSKLRLDQENNINDNLLLLNRFCSVSISANEHKEFRRNCFEKFGTYVVDVTKQPYEANNGDPQPLFFCVFSHSGIKESRWDILDISCQQAIGGGGSGGVVW